MISVGTFLIGLGIALILLTGYALKIEKKLKK